jgi:pyruvate dehydrogenase E2 component (dihydrolipoamide acetyltransferase)
MPFELTMPQLSDTMTEGTLVKWNKKVGDAVKAGEEIADVETDKATMPMESAEAGVLAAILIPEGGKVPVGGVVGIVALKGENAADVKASVSAGGGVASGVASGVADAAQANGGSGGATGGSVVATVAVSSPDRVKASPDRVKASPDRVKASPLARRIAEQSNIDLTTLTGTGPNGRIVQKDVLVAIESGVGVKGASPAAASASVVSVKPAARAVELPARIASGAVEKIELTKMRQTIALRLQQSKQQIPHFYETIDIDMTAANALRQKLIAAYEKSEGVRISIGDIIAKAVACALKAVPALNSTFDEKTSTVTRHGDVNLGMAVALPDGLIVPVLRNIDQMGIKEIRQRSADIVDRARQQRLKKDEMSGATFTVSNLGVMGIREFSAIVNPPEVGILAIGATEERAVVRGGQIVVRAMMTVTLSADHRVIDGAVAAAYLGALKGYLEEPATMLA